MQCMFHTRTPSDEKSDMRPPNPREVCIKIKEL
jgi:hypothetical protein